jgi:hypothetical protein
MNKKTIIEKFFGFTEATYYNWRRENRLVIDFIEKYISDEDLIEFINSGHLKRLEINREIDSELEDFAFKTAIFKIKTNKNWAMSLFHRVLDESNITTKQEYLLALDNIKTKLIKGEHSNWKNIVRNFVEEELSNLEMRMLIKNKHLLKQIVSESTKED